MRRFCLLLILSLPLAAGDTYRKLPLGFEPNQGQVDGRVKFLARVPGYTLFVTSDEAVFAGHDGSVERMKFIGANRKMRAEPLDKQPGISNYFIGNDPAKWRTNIPNYGRIALREVYPGIDLIFYSRERQLEYDWLVAPGADPKQIRVKWEGAHEVSKNADGDLELSTSLRQKRPVILQDGKLIEGGYLVRGKQVTFAVAKYDASKPLVIDPVLVYSTYLGGSTDENGYGIAVDGVGNAYVTGRTLSTNFPTTNPLQASNVGVHNAFVTKINAAGSALLYSTYLGGSGDDQSNGIAVDGAGNAYVTGEAASTDFPTAAPLQASQSGGGFNAFVTKINPEGSALVYSTYLGGGGDIGDGIAVDGAGNAYVTGFTHSTNFPTVNPIQSSNGGASDAFVSKINAAGSALVYSTYLGGPGFDSGNSIAVDGLGNAYVTGEAGSANFPTASPLQANYGGGAQDAFVAKINVAGSALVYSTYLGGSLNEVGDGIAVDGSGNAYVTGPTSSSNFPKVNPLKASLPSGDGDAFVTKINAAGSALIYSTYLGGSMGDYGLAIAVDGAGNAYVTGFTTSIDFPTVNSLEGGNGGSGNDPFVTKINAAGSALVYSTYLGSSGGGWSIAVDGTGKAYVTGYTTSPTFSTANPLQASIGGAQDAFVSVLSSLTPRAVSVSPSGGSGASQSFTFTFSHSNGWQNLQVVDVLIQGNFVDGRNACYVAIVPSANQVLLVDDAGDAGGPFGVLVLPATGGISNSQCSINATGSSMSGSGNTLTVTLSLTFGAGFAGNKVFFMAAGDTQGANTGWQVLGTWNSPGPPTSPAAVGGMNPDHGTPPSNQIYTFTFTDTNGVADLGVEDILINSALDGRQACYIAYLPSSNSVLLVDDAGDAGGPFGVLALPTGNVISNNHCTINGSGSSASMVGNTLTLTLSITFSPQFVGNRLFFLAASSQTGQNSNWQAVGLATVP